MLDLLVAEKDVGSNDDVCPMLDWLVERDVGSSDYVCPVLLWLVEEMLEVVTIFAKC